MIISTRGRYALRVMMDLAEHDDGSFIPMKDVAQRQGVSLKYLERILPSLTKSGMIEGVHGKGGGYRLNARPGEIRVGDVLRLTEGDLAPVTCVEEKAHHCEHHDCCRTYPMWNQLNRLINDYLDGITLSALLKGEVGAGRA